jgi:uncharacterized membrane protein YbhN (UPF0104 family)
LKKKQWILGLIVVVALVVLGFWAGRRVHFNFTQLRAQLALADWRIIGIAVAAIYVAYVVRAARWALLLRHNKKVSPFALLGTQVIGFTAVALIGRVADLVRPYLVAKKTSLPLSSQMAVYIVERLFDAGSMALIFSVAMLWIPADEILKASTHSGPLVAKLAVNHRDLALLLARYGILALTLLGALFMVAVRWSGGAVASACESILSPISKNLGRAVGEKIRTFRTGLDTMRSFGDFAATASLSIGMWLLIGSAYFEGCRAFVASPQLAAMTAPQCVLLMVASGGASIIQLPVIGWFSQIGAVAVTLAAVAGASAEAATACAATLLLVTFLSIVPVGLIWARFDNVSLRKVAAESGDAGEDVTPEPAAVVAAETAKSDA